MPHGLLVQAPTSSGSYVGSMCRSVVSIWKIAWLFFSNEEMDRIGTSDILQSQMFALFFWQGCSVDAEGFIQTV